jgi:3-hydroxyethyl bacteriochlorophyllide a dehydrogenase
VANGLSTVAVIFEEPERVALRRVDLSSPCDGDVVVDIEWSGISTGTERLLWSGRMPPFPGMGYPLVPGYESVGRVASVGPSSRLSVGDPVFVPGARCFGDIRGLFGGSAARVVVPESRAVAVDGDLGEDGVLLALAATAHHAIAAAHAPPPELIVGHGVLGRLLARIVVATGAPPPVVWERNAARREGARGYQVMDPADDDANRTYRAIYDASGDASLLDRLIMRLAHGGEIVLAGFYSEPLAFAFPPAFMREARIRIAAEWQPTDLDAVKGLIASGRLSLSRLISHRQAARSAATAYDVAFSDPACLKMVLDWRPVS